MAVVAQTMSSHEPDNGKEHQWIFHVNQQKGSGLSRADYCRKHQLNYHQFGYWDRKYRAELSSTDLVPIHLEVPPLSVLESETVCTVLLKNGHELKIHDKALLPILLSFWS